MRTQLGSVTTEGIACAACGSTTAPRARWKDRFDENVLCVDWLECMRPQGETVNETYWREQAETAERHQADDGMWVLFLVVALAGGVLYGWMLRMIFS